MASFTPTPSGRSTPLTFKDVVSTLNGGLLQECGHLFECACKTMHTYAVHMLTGLSQQVHDVMKQWKSEKESEAHQARPSPSYYLRKRCRLICLRSVDLP